MERDPEEQELRDMVVRFRATADQGEAGARQLLNKLFDEESEAREASMFGRAWRVLISEFKKRGTLQVGLLIGLVRSWASNARSRAEAISLASSESLACSFGSLVVVTSLTLTTFTPAIGHAGALPTLANSFEKDVVVATAVQDVDPNLFDGFSGSGRDPAIRASGVAGSTVQTSPDLAKGEDRVDVSVNADFHIAGYHVSHPLHAWVYCDNPRAGSACLVLRALPQTGFIH